MTILDALGLTGGRNRDPWAGMREVTNGASPAPSQAPQAAPAQGGGMRDFLSALGPAIAMLDPRNQQLGMGLMAMNAARREKAEKRENQNVTANWLQKQGLGAEEAAFIASNPNALSSWVSEWRKGNSPDWQISTVFDDQGREQRAMIDKNTGRYNVIGGAKVDKPDAAPSDVREYEYAKGQGFGGSYMDWKAANRSNTNLTVGPDGTISFNQGAGKPLTEGQSKDVNYYTRAAGSLQDVNKYGDSLTELGGFVGDKLPGGWGNFVKSKEYQLGENAGREWLAPILRKDTGAAITKQEMDQYGSIYLPQPGDAPEVLERKKAARTRATDGLKAGMTPEAILKAEGAIGKTGDAAPKVDWRFNQATGKLEKVQ